MVEKVSEIYNNIKDRLSNPLIFSFICSWLIYNWRITIAVLWYDPGQVNREGYISIFDFINDTWNKTGSLYIPILIAIGYTILIPIIRSLIRLFNSFVLKITEEYDSKIVKGSVVSIDKYLEYRKLFENRTKELSEVISEETKYMKENENLRRKIRDSEDDNRQLENQIRSMSDVTYLDGFWIFTIKSDLDIYGDKSSYVEKILIENGRYFIQLEGARERLYIIQHFFLHSNHRRLTFVKSKFDEESNSFFEQNFVNYLDISESGNLSGFENGRVVTYERIGGR